MAKQGGLGSAAWVAGVDVTGDIQQFATAAPLAVLDMTDISKKAFVRIGGQRSGSLDLTSFFDKTGSHVVFSTLPTTDVQALLAISPVAIGSPAVAQISKQVDYPPTRDTAGMLTEKVSVLSNGYGQEWGQLLTAGARTDTTATNGTAYDYGAAPASTSFGFQAYLQALALTGANATVTLQDSADNATFANLGSGAFAAVSSAPSTQRLAVGGTATVRRYVRAITSGTFTSFTFVVMFVRNQVATNF